MSITIEITPSTQSSIEAEAAERGVSVSDVVRRLLERAYPAETTPLTPRPLGRYGGRIIVPDDFDEPLPDEVLEAFEGR